MKATDHGHTMQLCFTQLLRKTSLIDRVKVNGKVGWSGSLKVRTHFARPCFSTFFSRPTFFPRARGQRGENSETQLSQEKKRPGLRSTTPYQPPTGRWMNFLTMNPEPTPYSDAHVCAPCNLINAHAFTAWNVCDASTFSHLKWLCSQNSLLTHALSRTSDNFCCSERAQSCASIGGVCHTRSKEKLDHQCV
jgi:hypothetical protein